MKWSSQYVIKDVTSMAQHEATLLAKNFDLKIDENQKNLSTLHF
jgi:hypothetical protein